MGDFRNLRVWQAARQLVIDVDSVCKTMRGSRSRSTVDQLLRAVGSVANNIVEGNAHQSTREFIRFLGYSVTSAWEVEGHLQLALDLGMIRPPDYKRLVNQVIDVRRMLYGLIKKLKDNTADDDV